MSERIIQRTPNLGIAIRMQPLTLAAAIEPVATVAPCVPSITGPFWYNPETDEYDLEAVTGIIKRIDMSCTLTKCSDPPCLIGDIAVGESVTGHVSSACDVISSPGYYANYWRIVITIDTCIRVKMSFTSYPTESDLSYITITDKDCVPMYEGVKELTAALLPGTYYIRASNYATKYIEFDYSLSVSAC